MRVRAPLSALVGLVVSFSAPLPAAVAAGAWSPSAISSSDLADVSFPSPSVGFAVGAGGTVLRTADGGVGWTRQESGTEATLSGVDFVDASRGWAVGSEDTVLATSDGGATWTRLETGTGATLRAVDFVDADRGWTVGVTPSLSPVVAATSDGGRTWTAQTAKAGVGLLAVSFADAQHGMAVGFAGSAYRTTDGGDTWIPMLLGVGFDPTTVDTFHSVQMLSATQAVVGSFEGYVYGTVDGGLTWNVRATLGRSVLGLAAAGHHVFAAGGRGLVARSEDGGEDWTLEVSGSNEDLRGVSAPAPGAAWAVGSHGSVVRFESAAGPPTPLRISLYPQSCHGGVGIEWIHGASGAAVDAVGGDLRGDGETELVLAGPEGLRAVRPFVPTSRATMWRLRFQAAFQQIALAELDGDRRPEIVGATARTSEARDGVLAVAGESGRVLWSRTIPGGAQIIRARDLDGDGLDDLVAMGNDQAVHLLSGRSGRDLRAPVPLGDDGTDVQVGDLIGTGQPVVVATLRNGRAIAFDATSGAVLWRYRAQGQGASLRAVALADLDGDRAVDVVLGGNGQATSASGATAAGNAVSSSPGALVVALKGYNARRLWDHGETGPSQVNALAPRDLGGDHVPDVVAQISRPSGSHTIALDGLGRVVNGLSTGEPAPIWDTGTSGGTGLDVAFTPDELVIADGTGDGWPDVYEALQSGRFLAIGGGASQGGVARSVPVAPTLWESTREIPAYHVSWVRARGKAFVLTLSGDQLVALRHPSSGDVAWSFDGGGTPALTVGDLDGDGRPDIGVGDRSGRAYGLDASGTVLSEGDLFWPAPVAAVAAADVDGDGRAELVAGSGDGLVRAFDPVTNRVRWTRKLPAGVTALSAGGGVIAAGRADGVVDGLNQATGRPRWTSTPDSEGSDAVSAVAYLPVARMFAAGDSAGTIRLLAPTSGARRVITIGTAPTGGVYAVAPANLVGDGRPEIVVAAGSSFYAYTVGGERLWAYEAGSFATRVAAVDLTGDGRDDVVGMSWDGNAYGLHGSTGGRLWSSATGRPAGVASMRSAGGAKRILLATSFDNGFAGVRIVSTAGRMVGSCRLRKTPFSVVSVPGPAGIVDAVVSTDEGDVYRFTL